MNPVLLKPTSHMGPQAIVNGEVLGNLSAAEYFKMKKSLIPEIKRRRHNSLAERFDVIVVEELEARRRSTSGKTTLSTWAWQPSTRRCCWGGRH